MKGHPVNLAQSTQDIRCVQVSGPIVRDQNRKKERIYDCQHVKPKEGDHQYVAPSTLAMTIQHYNQHKQTEQKGEGVKIKTLDKSLL